MLKYLKIDNVAVIKHAEIDFTTGLNILTGETGAGKSIVIDSINAILGERISKDIVRTGCEKAKIIAEFTDLSKDLTNKLDEFELEYDDDTLVIMRTITAEGKSSCRINGIPVTNSILKEIGRELISICGQHDSQKLLQRSSHIQYIDSLAKLSNQLSDYKDLYSLLKKLEKELNSLLVDENEKNSRIDYLQYQINEIENAAIYEGEKDELTEQKKKFLNKDKNERLLHEIENLLNGEDNYQGVIDSLYQLSEKLGSLSEYSTEYNRFIELVDNFKYEIEDCRSFIGDELMNFEYQEISIDEVEERLDIIYRLTRKYGGDEASVLKYLEDSQNELQQLYSSNERIEELEPIINEKIEELIHFAKEISNKRKVTALEFSSQIKEELDFLDMHGADFEVSFDETEPSSSGIDNVEFLFSANKGQECKPLSKIASGGELSRVMLAIRCVLSSVDTVNTTIFDEIDAGVSGRAANKIAIKLKEFSNEKQVICVTHLAQIAAYADNHLYIEKNIVGGDTETDVKCLDYNSRINEIARIIGGDVITETTLNSAKELIEYSKHI